MRLAGNKGACVMLVLAALTGCQPSGAPPATSGGDNIPANASREEVERQAKIIGCYACHANDKKLLGPGWKHVAQLYRGDPAGEAKLMEKIAKGGAGVWGSIEMPAYPGLSEGDRRALARYILSLE